MPDPIPADVGREHLAGDHQGVFVPRWAMRDCDGDPRDAMLLAQITYWFQPSQRDGRPRTHRFVERNGALFMWTNDADLAMETGMGLRVVRRARASLVERGLIECASGIVLDVKRVLVRPLDHSPIPANRRSEGVEHSPIPADPAPKTANYARARSSGQKTAEDRNDASLAAGQRGVWSADQRDAERCDGCRENGGWLLDEAGNVSARCDHRPSNDVVVHRQQG